MAEIVQEPGFFESMSRKFQYLLDRSSPHPLLRWIIFFGIVSLYTLRVYLVNGWYIVTYGLGIYVLNQFIGFLTPQVCNFKILIYSIVKSIILISLILKVKMEI